MTLKQAVPHALTWLAAFASLAYNSTSFSFAGKMYPSDRENEIQLLILKEFTPYFNIVRTKLLGAVSIKVHEGKNPFKCKILYHYVALKENLIWIGALHQLMKELNLSTATICGNTFAKKGLKMQHEKIENEKKSITFCQLLVSKDGSIKWFMFNHILLEETLMIFKLVFYRIYKVDAQIDHPVSG